MDGAQEMYESFYGFREKPFQLPPDPEYVFMSETHAEVFTHLEYAIQENKGFVVITGEIGAGKTTLMNVLLDRIPQDVETAVITQTNLEPGDFLKMVCDEFELDILSGTMAEMLDALHSFLLQHYELGNRVVLIVDESQNLPLETIEELRMLSNLELEKQHLLQMILLGQPNLKDKLRRKELEQFSQRVTVHCHLRGLNRAETEKYIRHRLTVAGSTDPDLFTKEAMDYVYKAARGIPRLINIICDGALLYGYADEVKKIDKGIIYQIIKERQALITSFHKPSPAAKGPSPEQEEELLNRMDTLEGHMERLYALVDNHISDSATKDREVEARIVQKVRRMLDPFRPPEPDPDRPEGVRPGAEKGRNDAGKGTRRHDDDEGMEHGALSRLFRRLVKIGRN